MINTPSVWNRCFCSRTRRFYRNSEQRSPTWEEPEHLMQEEHLSSVLEIELAG